MQIVRAPSIYERREAERKESGRRKRRSWPVWLVGGAAVIAAASAAYARTSGIAAWENGGGFFAAWAVIVLLVTLLGWAGSQTQGEAGEAAALAALRPLGEEWTAIVSLKIPGFERIGDVDILLVGPPGVVAVEVKNLRGAWRVEGDHWVRLGDGSPGLRRGVGGQLKSQIHAVGKFLGREGAHCRITGLIAVTANAAIEIAAAGPYSIVPYDRLAATVAALPKAAGGEEAAIERAREALCCIATKR